MRFVLSLAVLLCLANAAAAAGAPRISIIIDDLGYSLEAGLRTVRLPGPVVCAILPQTPRAALLGELAHEHGKDVLLHLPLEAENAPADNEPGAIRLDTTRRAFASTFAENLASVPHAIGINGHRGSLLTRHPGHMQWLMEEVGSRDLLFVDSYTTHRSVALAMAREAGVPATRRHVFLDNEPDPGAIGREFERLVRLAKANGSAVAIGHPYPETLDFLEARLPALAADGVELVSIRQMIGSHRMTVPPPALPRGDTRFASCTSGPKGDAPIEPACLDSL